MSSEDDATRRAVKGLTGAVLRSSAWLGSLQLFGRLLDIARLLILARLLGPRDFGLFAIGALAVSWTATVTAYGAGGYLIHRGERAPALYDTAWTLRLIRRALAAVTLVTLAPLIARFLGSPDATAIIRVMALVPLLRAFRNVGMVEYQRDLRWGPESMLQTVSQVTELGITIGLAWRLGSAWALVGGALAEAVVDTILTYVRHPYRPSLHLARGEVRALFRFGRWEFGSKVASWLLSGGLQIVVGKVLGLEALGLFRVARRLAVKPVSQVGDILAKIAQSAYAKLQGSPDRLRRAHLRVLGAVALASTPVAVGMIIYGGDVARHLLGPRWEGATSLVQIFALCGLMETLNDATASLFRATGRPELHTMRAALQLTILTVLVGPLAIWLDAVGVALAVAVATSVATAAALWRAARDLRIPGRELALVLGGPSLASLPLLMLRALVPGHLMATLPGLVGTLIASALLYGLTLLLLAQARWYPLATAVPTGFQHWLPSSARFDVARRT